MRARYYSPDMRRFLNADLLHGDISNAITLNRYAYANGNPVSNVDPFGLSAERGSIGYKGKFYQIFSPNNLFDQNWDDWTIVGATSFTESNVYFDWTNFLIDLTMNLDDMDGVASGEKKIGSQQITANFALYSLRSNLLKSLAENHKSNSTKINFRFLEKNGENVVVITTGTDNLRTTLNQYAGKTIRATSLANNCGEIAKISHGVESLYKNITGSQTSFWKTYDLKVSVDQQHKDSYDINYLWKNQDQELVTSPVLYDGDKVEIGTGYFSFSPLYSIPLNGSSPASKSLQTIFDKALKEKNMTYR